MLENGQSEFKVRLAIFQHAWNDEPGLTGNFLDFMLIIN